MIEINSLHEPASHDSQFWLYNGMDSMMTWEIFEKLEAQLTPAVCHTYDFTRTMQAPAMEMMCRGLLVDNIERQSEISFWRNRATHLQSILNQFAQAVWGKDLNPNSPVQVKAFFYSSEGMNLPEIYTIKGGKRSVSSDREALEKLTNYLHARPIANTILALRDCIKTLGMLTTAIDEDSRIRASYNVAGTDTGRWSSSENAFGTGTNFQTVTERLRPIFIAETGKRLAYCDLEQAESRLVGMLMWALFREPSYIDACECGDLHTTVCQMVWGSLKAELDIRDKAGNILIPAGSSWSANGKLNKALAGQPFYREMSYRDMAKRGGHGSNYMGTPPTMAKHLKVETKLISDFQEAYFKTFPIRNWHKWVRQTLQTTGKITSLTGRTRTFFDRLYEDSTLRKAIAYDPQGTIGDVMNFGISQVQRKLGTLAGGPVELLAQIHDAAIFQYPEHMEVELIPQIISLLETKLTIHGRDFTIPAEALCGWNWGKAGPKNPDGLKLFTSTPDTRTRSVNAETPLLHRVLR